MSYSDVREKSRRGNVIDFTAETRLPCRWCQKQTLVSTLAEYGARCFACYEAYCRDVPPVPQMGDKRRGPRAWAYALRARDQRCDPLTLAQRNAWRRALERTEDVSDDIGSAA